MNRGRTNFAIAGIAALLVGTTACGGSAPSVDGKSDADGSTAKGEKGTVTVGLLNPTSGPFAALGRDVNAGFQTYLDSKNGVLSGYGIKVVKEDEANDAGKATTKARQLVEQNKAQVVVGLVNSAVAYAVAPYLEKAKVPLLITVAGADGLTRTKNGNVFRVSYTSSQDTMPAGEYACKTLGHKTAAVVALDYSFGWEGAGGFARTYEDAGCDVVQEIYAPLATQDWGPYVNQIKKSADTVFVVAPGSDGIRFFKAYRGFGGKAPVIAHGSTTDEQLLRTEADAAKDAITSLHYTPQLDTAVNKKFVKQFKDATDREANQYAEDGYTAAMTLEATLAGLDGKASSATIKKALAGASIKAPRGPMKFDEYGQAVYNVYMRKVVKKDGGWVNEPIKTFPDTSQFWTYDAEEYLGFPPYEKLKGTWSK